MKRLICIVALLWCSIMVDCNSSSLKGFWAPSYNDVDNILFWFLFYVVAFVGEYEAEIVTILSCPCKLLFATFVGLNMHFCNNFSLI